VVSHPGHDRRIPKLNSKRNLHAAMALLRGDRSVRAELLRDRIAEIRRLDDKIAGIDKRIPIKVKESGTTLTQAARHRLHHRRQDPRRGRGSFAAPLAGIVRHADGHRSCRGLLGQDDEAPVESRRQPPAQLRAPHDGLARCRGDANTKAYMARLRVEGKSDKESMRCLKRQLSNVIYRQLVADLKDRCKAA
jgi:transposase